MHYLDYEALPAGDGPLVCIPRSVLHVRLYTHPEVTKPCIRRGHLANATYTCDRSRIYIYQDFDTCLLHACDMST